jgi:hypothetical protein
MWWYIGNWVSKVIPGTTAHSYTKHTQKSQQKKHSNRISSRQKIDSISQPAKIKEY